MEKTGRTGERVGGYRVVRCLATGGTTDVLLAKAEGPHGFERSVVLKKLLPQYNHDDDLKGMFAREAGAYARLSHPAIVRLYDFFSHDDQLVMVLEYVEGPPLSRLRGMLEAIGEPVDDATALFVAGSLFEALAAAHAATDDRGEPAPVIHRDVSPSNVLIAWDGHVKLADFGIAKVTGASHHSSAGLIKGTYGYMAPEQVKGENVTPRADVYAGAIVLWEMLTQRRAFVRGVLPEIEVLRELAEPRIVSIDVLRPDLDKQLRDVLKRALEPRADRRNVTAEELVSTLRDAVPAADGRERLARVLASVRHEPSVVEAARPHARDLDVPAKALARDSGRPTALPPPAPSDVGLAALLEPSQPRLPAVPRGPNGEELQLGAELAAIAPGMALRDAIDKILSDNGSSAPPYLFPKTDLPEQFARANEGSLPDLSSVAMAEQGERRRATSLVPDDQKPTERPMPHHELATTTPTPMQAWPPLPPSTAKMRAAVESQPGFPPALPLAPALSHAPQAPEAPAAGSGSSPSAHGGSAAHVGLASVASAEAMPGAPRSSPHAPSDVSSVSRFATARPGSLAPRSMPSSRRGPPLLALFAILVVAIGAGGAGTAGYLRWTKARLASPATSSMVAARPSPSRPRSPFGVPEARSTNVLAPTLASASVPPPPANNDGLSVLAAASAASSAASSASASASASELPLGAGRVKTTGTAPGRRIFVDDKTVGQTPDAVIVKCGLRSVKLGRAGTAQTVDVPCGGEISVGDR